MALTLPHGSIPFANLPGANLQSSMMYVNENILAIKQAIADLEKQVASITGESFAATDHTHDEDYAAVEHTHDTEDVSGLDAALAGKADANHTHSGYLTSVPAHSHTEAQVTGLVQELNNKAASNHIHPIEEVVGLRDQIESRASIEYVDSTIRDATSADSLKSAFGELLEEADVDGSVKSVNSQEPDDDGNISITAENVPYDDDNSIKDKIDGLDADAIPYSDTLSVKQRIDGLDADAIPYDSDDSIKDKIDGLSASDISYGTTTIAAAIEDCATTEEVNTALENAGNRISAVETTANTASSNAAAALSAANTASVAASSASSAAAGLATNMTNAETNITALQTKLGAITQGYGADAKVPLTALTGNIQGHSGNCFVTIDTNGALGHSENDAYDFVMNVPGGLSDGDFLAWDNTNGTIKKCDNDPITVDGLTASKFVAVNSDGDGIETPSNQPITVDGLTASKFVAVNSNGDGIETPSNQPIVANTSNLTNGKFLAWKVVNGSGSLETKDIPLVPGTTQSITDYNVYSGVNISPFVSDPIAVNNSWNRDVNDTTGEVSSTSGFSMYVFCGMTKPRDTNLISFTAREITFDKNGMCVSIGPLKYLKYQAYMQAMFD